MDIHHLQHVSEIARHNSFTKAAEALHITQPTISKSIKNLENELNVSLFVRHGNQIKLTEAGEAIVKYAAPILQLFDQLSSELNDLTYLNTGSIRIGLPPMAGPSFFPGVIKAFQERYPGITVKLVENGARTIKEYIEDGSLEVGVVLLPVDSQIFDSFPIVEDRLNVILPLSHSLAERQWIELDELSEEPFILFSSEFALHHRILNECRAAGFEPRVVYESSQWDFIGEMVGAGLGIAMLPDTICRSLDSGKVKAVPLINPFIPWQLAIAWKREGYLPIAAKEWIAFTREMFLGK
ncbi:DNA-binding transcriptional LysR family regulator [Paenibacillus castaneae]|uniref:LysR family transcriptional regulator n=1 Tax=Paenibacillus castaneae TaxID=474957 RepID=UPI000C9A9B19|nr:LysR family transcriptional regulator [Paenibacillus castaneae]NIK76802.1 DNA-binding transcriptional LysR family regulator [Paenibacillus castaneae]